MNPRIALPLSTFILASPSLLAGCATLPAPPANISAASQLRYANTATHVLSGINQNALASKTVLISASATSPYTLPSALTIATGELRAKLDQNYTIAQYGAYRTASDQLFSALSLSNGEAISSMEKIRDLTKSQRFIIVALDKGGFVQCVESIRFARRQGLPLNVETIFAINIDATVLANYSGLGVQVIPIND